MGVSLIKSFDAPSVDYKEILRYAGQKESTDEYNEIIVECLEEITKKLTFNVCYRPINISVVGAEVMVENKKITSSNLAKNLEGCKEGFIFVSTIGLEIDRAIEKYKKISPLKALIMHAIGVERIESLADAFCNYLSSIINDNQKIKPRFSPGYGDFSLEDQGIFFELLDAGKLLGVSLNDSYLMSPSKSVSAIVGITKGELFKKEDCAQCEQKDCAYRR